MKNLYLLITGLLMVSLSYSQTPELFADINQVSPQNFSSTSQEIHATSNELFYTSDIRSLAVYDGTDFIKYDQVDSPDKFTTIGSRTYFVGTGSISGEEELWYYENGNLNEIDINLSGSSNPDFLTVYDNELYFQADGGTNGIELWKYDGSSLSEIDITIGVVGSEPKFLVVYGDELVFFATDETAGAEPHTYDGSNVSMVSDVRSGAAGSLGSPNPYFEVHQGSLFFTANDGTGNELWEYDGTEITKIDINPSGPSTPLYTTSFGSDLYTSASTTGTGYELWKYDGTSVSLVEDIQLGSGSSVPTAPDGSKFFVSGGNMYFLANNGTDGEELYKFDGTTLTLIDINTNPDFSLGRSLIENMVELDDQIFFGALTEEAGYELRSYDGTTITTYDIRSGSEGSNVSELTLFGESLIFGAKDGDGTSFWHLWEYDENGASPFGSSTEESSSPEYFVLFDGLIYFTANDGIENTQVWVTDGTSVSKLEGLPSEYYFADITLLDGRITFYGEGDDDEKQFFFDGTTLTSIDVILNRPIEFNGEIFFAGESEDTGQELFKYDGTEVTLVEDIRDGPLNSSLGNFILFNDKLVFTADDGTNGRLLWEYDGTSVQLIEDINPGFTNTSYGDFMVVGNNLFFAGFTGANGFELYRYDGSDVEFIDIIPGAPGSGPQKFLAYNDQLIFQATGESGGVEMFVHDGTTLTNLDINESGGSFPTDFTIFNDKVYFAADDGINGHELWQYDGTNASLAADINVGSGSSEIEDPFVNGPYLYFRAYNFDRPTEANYEHQLSIAEDLNGLFRFDGEGFDFVSSEVYHEFNNENESIPVILDNYVYFRGESPATGEELYRMRAISEEAAILTFSLAEQSEDAVIDPVNKVIDIKVPAGTDVTSLAPSLTISALAAIDLDGVQDFTNSVIYTVTSEFGNTEQWTVNVSVGLYTGTDILSFSVVNQVSDASIDASAHTIDIIVSREVDITAINPSITTAEGSSISPEGAQDFTNTVIYTVTAEDGNTQEWMVDISVELFAGTDILTFTVANQVGSSTIDAASHAVSLVVPFDADVTTLDPTITVSEGASISPEGAQDFTNAVTYTVTAEDGGTQDWTVIVTKEDPPLGFEDEIAIEVYPNPATDFVHIKSEEQVTVDLTDLKGQSIKSDNGQSVRMNLSDLRSGIYILRITNGESTTYKRIIKAN